MSKERKRRRKRPAREPVGGDSKQLLRPGPLAPDAFPLDGLAAQDHQTLARMVGVSPDGPDLLRRLARVMADPQHVAASLRKLPVQALLVLEVVAEWGGVAEREALERELARRHPGVDCPLEPIGDLLMSRGFCGWGTANRTGAELMMLLTPRAERVASAVLGVSLPGEPPPESARAHAPRAARDMLALATLAAHRRVRLTKSGTIDRTILKTFAKKLGPHRGVIERALEEAVDLDLVNVRSSDHRLLPEARPLMRYASGLLPERLGMSPTGGRLGELLDALPAQGWVPQDALVRWLTQLVYARRLPLALLPHELEPGALLGSGALEVAEASGEPWVRRRDPRASADWRGDGHVTPSFEVMLGPAASLEVVAVVGLAAELVRLDHVLTFKLTAATVAAGLAAGVTSEDLWRALGAVGPHGLPSNVEALVGDWVQKACVGHLERGWFLVVPAERASDLCAGPLGRYVTAVRAPGVLALSGRTPRAVVEDALAGAGIQVRGGPAGRSSHGGPLLDPASPDDLGWAFDLDDDDYDGGSTRVFEQLLALSDPSLADPGDPESVAAFAGSLLGARPDAELRGRVRAALREGLEPLAHVALSSDPLEEARGIVEAFRGDAQAEGAPAFVLQWFDALAELWARRFDELAHWYRNLPPAKQPDAVDEIGFPLLWMPWLVLSKTWRQRALQRSTPEAVLAESERLTRPDRFDPDVAPLIPVIADPQVHQWLQARAEHHAQTHGSPPDLHLVDPDRP